MGLSQMERAVRGYMYKIFIPELHKMIQRYNKKEYDKWEGNCCRQTAVFGADLLSRFLPHYEWQVWDGVFDDMINGKPRRYNHAWIYGIDRVNKRRLLVDLSRVAHERLFTPVKGNRYPKDHPDYKDMKEVSRERLDWRSMVENDVEYYTNLPSKEFIVELSKRCDKVFYGK